MSVNKNNKRNKEKKERLWREEVRIRIDRKTDREKNRKTWMNGKRNTSRYVEMMKEEVEMK